MGWIQHGPLPNLGDGNDLMVTMEGHEENDEDDDEDDGEEDEDDGGGVLLRQGVVRWRVQ